VRSDRTSDITCERQLCLRHPLRGLVTLFLVRASIKLTIIIPEQKPPEAASAGDFSLNSIGTCDFLTWASRNWQF